MCKRKTWRYGILIVCLLVLVASCSCFGGTSASSDAPKKTPFQLLQESHTELSGQVAEQDVLIQSQRATIDEQAATIEELKDTVVLLEGQVAANTATIEDMAARLTTLEGGEEEGDESTQ